MPRTRVSFNSNAHQLGWLKTKYPNFLKYVLTITVGYSIIMEYCPGNRRKSKTEKGNIGTSWKSNIKHNTST